MTQQQVIPYMDEPLLAEALVYVYIAQFVRPDGPNRAGVLKGDCQRYLSQIKELLSEGDIQDAIWRDLRGFVTTATGTQRAQRIMQDRVLTHSNRLGMELDAIPPRFIQYLQDIILADELGLSDQGRPVQIGKDIGRYETSVLLGERPSYWCLLSNREVRDMRDRLFQMLTTLKLMVKAYSYVSTRGGETRDCLYVPSPELQSFFRDYVAKAELAGCLWPEVLEEMHSVFHILDGSTVNREELDRKTPVRYLESVNEFINECLTRQVLIESTHDPAYPYLAVSDIQLYNKERAARYQKPLLDFLLGQSPIKSAANRVRGVDTKLLVPGKEAVSLKPRESSQLFKVMLGTDENNSPVYWEPLTVPNPHILIVGSPGTGKTQTAKSIIFEAVRYSIHSFVIDFANEYGDPHLVELVLKPGDAVTVNPLDLLEGGPTDVVFRVSGILKKIFHLGDQQEGLVRNAVKNAYTSAGITEDDPKTWSKTVPPFSRVKDYMDELAAKIRPDVIAQRTLTRLEPLFDLKVFSASTQVMFDQIMNQGATIYLRDLPTEETKLAVAEFFLRWLWHRVIAEGEIRNQLRLLIVMDEAHKLAYDNSPVADFLRQGRKYGAAVILSTQQPDDFQSKELAFQNTAFHMAFGCNSEKHAQAMAKQIVIGKRDQTRVAQVIRKLKPFEALVAGQASENAERLRVQPYHERIQLSEPSP